MLRAGEGRVMSISATNIRFQCAVSEFLHGNKHAHICHLFGMFEANFVNFPCVVEKSAFADSNRDCPGN